MNPDQPWHHQTYYEYLEIWDDGRLIETYERLSRDLRLAGVRSKEHYARMGEIEVEMRQRGLNPSEIAERVQRERDDYFGE